MGIRRENRRFRKFYKQIIIFFYIISFIFAQAEYQILTIPGNAMELSLHNGFSALKNFEKINENSVSFLHYPSHIKSLNYSNKHYDFSLLDYGRLEDKIDNQLINHFKAYECLIKYNLHEKINDSFRMNFSIGGMLSKIGEYSSHVLISDFNIKTKIVNTHVLLSINNLGLILKSYTNHTIKLPVFSQLSLIKKLKNNSIHFGYDNIYNFNTDQVKHIISSQIGINSNLTLRLSNSSYRKKLLIDNYNTDFYYGMAIGLTIKKNQRSSFDIGICNLGTAGYVYGITINY